MKTRKLIWITSLAVIALIFAACDTGGGDAGGGDADGGNNASSAVELSETQTVEMADIGGSISISYPEGWFYTEQGGSVIVSNNEEAMAATGADFEVPEGVVLVNVNIVPGEMAGLMGVEGDLTPLSVLEVFSGFMTGDDMPEFGEPAELTIDSKPAASITGSDDQMSATIYVVDVDGTFIVGVGATRAGEADANADIIQAIVASVTFTAAE